MQSPLLEEGLLRGLINISALARDIQPRVERRVHKDVTEGAIVMALKRLSDKLAAHNQSSAIFRHVPDMMVRSNLFELTVSNSPTLPRKLPRLARLEAVQNSAHFFTVTSGVYETTIIASEALRAQIDDILCNEPTVNEVADLSSITLRLAPELLETPGSYTQILRQLAWEGINIIEIVSTYRELTVILRQQDADRAFSALKRAFQTDEYPTDSDQGK